MLTATVGVVVGVWSVTVILLIISSKGSDVQPGRLRHSSARDDLGGEEG